MLSKKRGRGSKNGDPDWQSMLPEKLPLDATAPTAMLYTDLHPNVLTALKKAAEEDGGGGYILAGPKNGHFSLARGTQAQ